MLSKKRKILFIILGIALILLLNKVGGSFIKNVFYTAVSPLQKTLYKAGSGVSGLFEGLFTAGGLKKEQQELAKQNILLKQEVLRLRSYEEETRALKQALGLSLEYGFQFVLADVVLFQPEEDAVLISAGREMGLREEMPVVTQDGVLVGRVRGVFEYFSSVLLISSEDTAFDVEIQGTSSESVLAAAEGASHHQLRFVLAPQEAVIKVGDLVKTTALGGKFPKELLVGEVSSAKKNDAESFQEGEIMPYFASTPLRKLFVITNFRNLQDE